MFRTRAQATLNVCEYLPPALFLIDVRNPLEEALCHLVVTNVMVFLKRSRHACQFSNRMPAPN